MLALSNIADMQQQIAYEIYRQQIMQRLPDPLCGLLPQFGPQFLHAQPRLPGVEAKLENNELWQQFHHIGTEMIITKSGRRMFPSMRVSLSGLEDEASYCVLLEMVPIGDCRYKFSGSQWVPAGGAEPQSPQRMYLHPDSPALGKHWSAQPLLFSKVKLTNNTLDANGHIVLASMHKYQPRLHVIRTAELHQMHLAAQQAFVFPETEFIAVTAYQNDRITKLKIDNNPFAKGFRESGQSRCKRKLSDSPPALAVASGADQTGGCCDLENLPTAKRLRIADEQLPLRAANEQLFMQPRYQPFDTLESNFYVPSLPPPSTLDYAKHIAAYPSWSYMPPSPAASASASYAHDDCESSLSAASSSSASSSTSSADDTDTFVDVVGNATSNAVLPSPTPIPAAPIVAAHKRRSFSILDILGSAVS